MSSPFSILIFQAISRWANDVIFFDEEKRRCPPAAFVPRNVLL